MTTTEATLARDPVKKDYVLRVPAMIELRVPAEFYERVWLKLAEEERIDFSDPSALSAHASQVGRVSRWWDHTHATRTILPIPSSEPELIRPTAPQEKSPLRGEGKPPSQKERLEQGPTVKQQREDRLRQAASTVPPSRWMDACRTPVPPEDVQGDARRKVLRERTEEKYVLEWLHEEWKAGRFQISDEAQAKEYPSVERLELVASAVNNNGFH